VPYATAWNWQRNTHTPVRTAEVLPYQPVDTDLLANREPELPSEVVRSKYFAMPPMTVAQALEQLELVDHDFYMFLNAETGEINVIYERNHGGYGVIQPRRTNGHPAENGNGKTAQNGTKVYTPSTAASVHKGT